MYKSSDGEEVSRALLSTSLRLHWDLEMVSKIKYLSIATKCVTCESVCLYLPLLFFSTYLV